MMGMFLYLFIALNDFEVKLWWAQTQEDCLYDMPLGQQYYYLPIYSKDNMYMFFTVTLNKDIPKEIKIYTLF